MRLYKVTSADKTLVGTKLAVPRDECDGRRWRTTFTAEASTKNDHYQITVTKIDEDGSTEPAEKSPFYVVTGAEQSEPRLCAPAESGDETKAARFKAFVGVAGTDTGERGSCCGCGVPEPMFPARYDGFGHYRPDMKRAICVVYDPRSGPFSKGIASVTPAEFSMGHCAAFVPVPADAGTLDYAYRFLIFDDSKAIVLHRSNQKTLA